MDFRELLNIADSNKAKSSASSVKWCSTSVAPPKKESKFGVRSDKIAKFLAKRKAEEQQKIADERKKKQELLALRAQSTKNSKKAKIMASRTKDNDFSKIKLTEDEVEAKRKRECELMRKNLADKVERMKARIEMEEKEKLLPRTRKRKKHKDVEEAINTDEQIHDDYNDCRTSETIMKNGVGAKVRKPLPRPNAPALTFHDLLKVAEKKQFEPVQLPVKKKEEEKLMTKKERKLMIEEQERIRRKRELLERGIQPTTQPRKCENNKSNDPAKKNPSQKQDERISSKKPLVIHVEKNSPTKSSVDASKFKISRSNVEQPSRLNYSNNSISKKADANIKHRTEKVISKTNRGDGGGNSQKSIDLKKRELSQKTTVVKNVPRVPSIDQNAIIDSIKQQVRLDLEKEMEAKFAAQIAALVKQSNAEAANLAKKDVINKKTASKPPQPVVKKNVVKPSNNPNLVNRSEKEKMMSMKREAIPQRKPVPFHTNPYLDPPRRLLEAQRPTHKMPPKRRIESDDDEDEDDMSDFIDDGQSQNDEDYSKYIKEIFGYDRNRYVDEDDDDIIESSFVEQMKEEVRSTKLGYLEDLEEEKKEKAELKRKMKKKFKK